MILVSGFNVYPNEIEDVVMQHAGVREVAAVGVPSENSGEAVKIFVVKRGQPDGRCADCVLPPPADRVQGAEAGGIPQ